MSGPIFINYRRSISSSAAGRFADQLARYFDSRQIFIDVDGVEPGADFVRVLDERVADCSAFISVIAPNWADARDKQDRRRLDQPNDYVRIEIESALRRDIPVIPLLVDGAQMPSADELPDSIKQITRRNAVTLTHGRFSNEVSDLADYLLSIGITRNPDQAQSPPVEAPRKLNWASLMFGFEGRIARTPFWLGSLALVIASGLLLVSIAAALEADAATRMGKAIYWGASLPFYWPTAALLLKRLHDLGHGWQVLCGVIGFTVAHAALDIAGLDQPAVLFGGLACAAYATIGCVRGAPGPNAYGADPLGAALPKAT